MAFLYEQMDETIKGTNDVEGKLGVKLLGILPLINKGVLGNKRALPLNPLDIDDKKGTFIESVNTARTALSINSGVNNKIFLVTSSIPGEGKSTTSLNLAFSFSQLEKVLLIDCDMRRPSLAKALGLDKNAEGLSNLITRTEPARACIRRNVIGSLDIMTSGPIPQQPLELLSSNRFNKIIEQLSNHYDKIIIDSAPTQAVSDALVLSKLADAVVYVVKSHETSHNLVQRGISRLQQVNAPIAGVLMTQVDIDKITGYGGDYYYQGYYDYYGYSEKGGSKEGKSAGKFKLTPQELRQMKLDDDDTELDLGDYTKAVPALVNGRYGHVNGSDASGNAASAQSSSYDEEFDLTTRVSSLKSRRSESKPVSTPGFSDDLDLI